MSTWSDMNASQRNHLVGSLIGAKMLSQCYLAVDGKRVLVTPYAEEKRDKVELTLNVLRASDEMWAEFKAANPAATDEWRTKLDIDVERWHARYSDTPSGAWRVVEWLVCQGGFDSVGIEHSVLGTCVSLDVKGGGHTQTIAQTMPEAVCAAL